MEQSAFRPPSQPSGLLTPAQRASGDPGRLAGNKSGAEEWKAWKTNRSMFWHVIGRERGGMAPSRGVAALPCIARARSRALVDEHKTGRREFLGASPVTAGVPVVGVHALVWNCPRGSSDL